MCHVRSVMSRSSRIMCVWNAVIMTENLWPRPLNETILSCCKKPMRFLRQLFYFFTNPPLLFFLAPSIMPLY